MHIVPNGNMTHTFSWISSPIYTLGTSKSEYRADWEAVVQSGKESFQWTAKFYQ